MSRIIYKIIEFFIRLVYHIEAVGAENLPDEPCIIVGNHTQINGPLACELYFPVKRRTWCAGQMMELKEVPAYAFQDFWSFKPKWTHPFYRILSYLIAPLAVVLFNNAETIPVWRDMRLMTTFRRTMDSLDEGTSVVIFPEQNVKYNNILYDFQDRFIDTARFYYKRAKKELCFVPLYVAPALGKMYIGKPIRFDHTAKIEDERRRICDYLMNEITSIAASLPEHTVVPYRNIPKRLYPKNRPIIMYKDDISNEKTDS